MTSFELDPVDDITTDAVGEPGNRTFYIQARRGDVLVSLIVEKQQVALLAESIERLLERVGEPEVDAEPSGELEEPLAPAFRVGQIALGYDEDRDLVMLQCDEVAEPDEESDDPLLEEELLLPETEGATARMWATREQMRAFAVRGAAAVAAGRPVCRMCGAPMDAEGHFCPPSNGHREGHELS